MSTLRLSSMWLAVLAIVATIGLSACDSSDSGTTPTVAPETTTTAVSGGDDDPVVFGRGELPATVPSGFPIPAEAVVGTTMIDRINDVTEISLTYPTTVVAVVDYFEANLVAVGYSVDESAGTDGDWTITFSHSDGPGGTIRVVTAGSGVSQGAIRFVATS